MKHAIKTVTAAEEFEEPAESEESPEEYVCQFCRESSPATKWKNNRCPKCKREYEEE